MKEKTIQKTVYIAQDGKEFLNKKKECEKYEKEYLDKIKFFSIYYNFDYSEGRGFQSVAHVAVIPSSYDDAEVIAEKYAIDVLNEGVFAGQGCQGYGLQKNYSLYSSTRETFENNEGVNWGCNARHGKQILIAEESIKGFPEPFNYKKEWGIK